MSENANPITKVVTGKVRLSYAHLFTPQSSEDGKEPRYSSALLVSKSDTATLKAIKAAVEAVKVDPKSEKIWGKKFNASMKTPLRDGDVEKEDRPEYAGHYFFNATSASKPGIVGTQKGPNNKLLEITDPTEIYSGCYARVSVNFYAFNRKGGIGIAAGLNNVQKLEDGEPLGGGRARPDDDFGDGESPAGEDFLG